MCDSCAVNDCLHQFTNEDALNEFKRKRRAEQQEQHLAGRGRVVLWRKR